MLLPWRPLAVAKLGNCILSHTEVPHEARLIIAPGPDDGSDGNFRAWNLDAEGRKALSQISHQPLNAKRMDIHPVG